MNPADGGVCAPNGFTASGVAAGIKAASTKKDCALILSTVPASIAGMFTQNLMKSPPVLWNQSVCTKGTARGVFINSGIANAATGQPGANDVQTTADRLGNVIGTAPEEFCICSTGVIGLPLPMNRILVGIDGCVDALNETGSLSAAQAIMTTDTVPKEFACEVELSSGSIRFGAIAKGAGMISPNMATMICVITTDAVIEPDVLDGLLRPAVNASFNQICIDNDMSTSDTVLIFANGQSETPSIQPGTGDYQKGSDSLSALCRHMAQWLVKDGEGATKFVEIAVSGTETNEDAKTIARAIGNSQLCKTAFFGEDPNWGRFACAAGYAGVNFDTTHLDITLDDITICKSGVAGDYKEEDAAAVMKQPEFRIGVSVGSGSGRSIFWTSDLSHDYVSINADYRT